MGSYPTDLLRGRMIFAPGFGRELPLEAAAEPACPDPQIHAQAERLGAVAEPEGVQIRGLPRPNLEPRQLGGPISCGTHWGPRFVNA